ncbi:hypothetical protein [Domibacillus robiginosus]|uniref:hypothetical protein n=1 Tax=Domibacillus robiginosus TaxID=1071054 RepID=UPI0012E0A31E|nr:hypothetical protein [Domibacillus robiginosus]
MKPVQKGLSSHTCTMRGIVISISTMKGGRVMKKPNLEPIDFTPEKAERVKTVIEEILSRYTGTKIMITSYELAPRKRKNESA